MTRTTKTSSSWKAIGWVVLSIAIVSASRTFHSMHSARQAQSGETVAQPTVAEPTTSGLPNTVMHSDILNLDIVGAYPVTSQDNARMMMAGGQGAAKAFDLTCAGQPEIYLLPDDRDSLNMLEGEMSRAGYDRINLLTNPAGALFMTKQPRKVVLATVPNGLFVCTYVSGRE